MGLTSFQPLERLQELVLIHTQKQMVNSEIKCKLTTLLKIIKNYEINKQLVKLFTNMNLT